MDREKYVRIGMSLTRKEADAYCCALDTAQERYGLSRREAMDWFFALALKYAYDMQPENEAAREKIQELRRRIENLESKSSTVSEKKTGGFLYFIKAKDNLFKIGVTKKSPARRLSTLQTGCPYEIKLHVALYYDNCREKEREFHKLLAQYRSYGEWYEIDILMLDELIVQELTRSHISDVNCLADTTMPMYIIEETNRRLAAIGIALFPGGWPWDENTPREPNADIEPGPQ